MERIRITRSYARTIIATGLMALLAACSDNAPAEVATDKFTIETGRVMLTVKGDPKLFERHGGQILDRIDSVDPALIKPGIGLWVEQEPVDGLRPPLLLIGRVVAVEHTAGGYLAPAAPATHPTE